MTASPSQSPSTSQSRARARPKVSVKRGPTGYPQAPKPPTSMAALTKNKKYIGLFQMAERLTAHFDLEDPIQYMTPFGWWKYTKSGGISLPMPDPRAIIRAKGGRPTPVWRWSEIVSWYSGYAGVSAK